MRPQDSSKHLQGITDLTLVADILPGFIQSIDSYTFETRVRLVMKTLNALRLSSREHSPVRPFSDAVERIQGIHSFRLGVVEGMPRRLFLSVGFDGGWEPYIRRIWWDLGPFLDLMLCNCVGYVPACESTFEAYTAWIRRVQIDTGFYYVASGLTVTDYQYVRQAEKLHREGRDAKDADLAAASLVAADPEDVAIATARANLPVTKLLGLQALAALYRLCDVYPLGHADNRFLLRASHELLRELRNPSAPDLNSRALYPEGEPERNKYRPILDWFEQPAGRKHDLPERLSYRNEEVQCGIVNDFDAVKPMTHGCVLLMQVTSPADARAFVGTLDVTSEGAMPAGGIYVNLGLSYNGLAKLEVPDQELLKFPKEFREGMEARSGLLGDFRQNHPRNWPLPKRNWPHHPAAGDRGRVQLSMVDIVVQLRINAPAQAGDHEIVGNTSHPLWQKVNSLSQQAGIRLLSVEAMKSYRDRRERAIGHLDFADNLSQPMIPGITRPPNNPGSGTPPGRQWSDAVKTGDLLCGYVNSRDEYPVPVQPNRYLDNGSFLVVRKLALDVAAIEKFYAEQAPKVSMSKEQLKAKMMGRTSDGDPLAAPGSADNNFTYDGDPRGEACPFQAHARRANPRTLDKPKVPRIMRRGMSYGPKDGSSSARGLMFMAYNASIAEQFEVIQRWVAGGNASGVFSGEADPFLGVAQAGDSRTFRFLRKNWLDRYKPARVDLDGGKPFCYVEWGAYLFAPSHTARQAIAGALPAAPDVVAEGEAIIQQLRLVEQLQPQLARDAWKSVLDDLGAKEVAANGAVWAAIRANHKGVLKTPYGILAASHERVKEVFKNEAHYSVEGYAGGSQPVEGYKHRMQASIGPVYLGLDDGAQYRSESTESNRELMKLDEQTAFEQAFDATGFVLQSMLGSGAPGKRQVTLDLRKMLADPVLALVSKRWFDVPDGEFVASGGWDPQPHPKPLCPGDFTSPSRYIFSPHPGPAVQQYAATQGKAATAAVKEFVRKWRPQQNSLQGLFSKPMFAKIGDDDQLARTIVGAMMGFLPTVDGSFKSTLHTWLTDKSLWRVQAAMAAATGTDYDKAKAGVLGPLMRAMQIRPVPDIVWRTAKTYHQLGDVSVEAGERVCIGIVSATQELLEHGTADVFPIFGGNRKGDPQHPTHACPAYHAGMGVLLGMIAGLLAAGKLEPAPLPLTVTLIG